VCWAQATSPAVQGPQNQWRYKVTPSYYQTTQEAGATDLNVRANLDNHAMWIGQYDQANTFHQTRVGYEYTHTTSWGQIVPSLQGASGGFVGGSLNAQWGQSTYLIAGWGRTNLRPYYNLNFDPNDMVTWGLGTHLDNGHQVSVFTVKDNRLATDQIITHAVWRWQASQRVRWTVDVAHKDGRSSPGEHRVACNSVSIGYDRGPHFVRIAFDQKVNFSDNNQTRISAGLRF
jgi:hypothetical protein